MKKLINLGEEMPKFYGIAYHMPMIAQYVCYPFPINRIVGFFHKLNSTFNRKVRHSNESNFMYNLHNEVIKLREVRREMLKVIEENRRFMNTFIDFSKTK